jgi:hypothetical protein
MQENKAWPSLDPKNRWVRLTRDNFSDVTPPSACNRNWKQFYECENPDSNWKLGTTNSITRLYAVSIGTLMDATDVAICTDKVSGSKPATVTPPRIEARIIGVAESQSGDHFDRYR